MANNLGSMANALGAGLQTFQGIEAANQRRTEATQMQEQRKAELAEFKEGAPMRKEAADLELQQLRNQVQTQNKAVVQQMAIDGIGKYNVDGDVRHLNTWMSRAKQNPLGLQLHGDVARFDPLTRSPNSDKLLKQAGIANVDDVYNNPDKLKNLLLVTRSDGTQVLGDMHDIQVKTGYDKYASDEDLATRERESIITARLRQNISPEKSERMDRVIDSLMKGNADLTYAQAYEQVQGMGKTANVSGDDAAILQIRKDDPTLSYLDAAEKFYKLKRGDTGRTDTDKFIADYLEANAVDPQNPTSEEKMAARKEYAGRTPTTTQKELGSVDAVKDQLDEINFFDMDLSDASLKDKAKVHRHIAQIEDLRDIKLTNEDKRVMRDLSSLTRYAGVVGEELTEDQTGLVDNLLSTAKGYFIDEVGGKPAKAAYQAFSNLMLKTMSGQAVTEPEMKRFVKAAGSANLQLKPALSAFREQVMTIKNQLESIRDTNDPYLAHYYLGKDLGEVDDAIRQLDRRLGDIRSVGMKDKGPQSAAQTEATLAEKIQLQAPGATVESTGGDVKVDFDTLWKGVQPQ